MNHNLSAHKQILKDTTFYSLLLLLSVSVLAAFFSWLTPNIADDICYTFSWVKGQENQIVDGLADVFKSQNAHYMTWGGRYIAHLLVQCFCGMYPKLSFVIINGIMYFLFYFVMTKLCRLNFSNLWGVFSLIALGLLTFQTTYLVAFQVGYIWMATTALLYLLLFFKISATKKLYIYIYIYIYRLLSFHLFAVMVTRRIMFQFVSH